MAADFEQVKQNITDTIYENGEGLITGLVMQDRLLEMVSVTEEAINDVTIDPTVNVTVNNTTGTPSGSASFQDNQFSFKFGGIKGEIGKSAYQLWLDAGHQGTEADFLASLQGNPGSSQDYPFELENSLNGGTNKALTAEQGKVLDGKVTQLEAKVTYISENTGNLVQLQNVTRPHNGTTIEISSKGRIKITGTATQNGGRLVKQCTPFQLPAGSYRLVLSNTPSVLLYLENEVENAIIVTGAGTFTLTAQTSVYIGFNTNTGTTYNDDFGIAIYSDQSKTEYLPTITAEDSIARAKTKKNEENIAIIGPKANNAFQQVSALSPNANTKVFTQLESANKVIRHLFIDLSNYSGTYDLTGLQIRALYNDGIEISQISLENENDDILAVHVYGPNVPVHEWTENGIYLYAELNWDNMPSGSNRILDIGLTSEVFKPYNDPRVNEEPHTFSGFILGAAGDSITFSAGYPIEDGDPFAPITGGANKSWAYFIAKHYNMQWHNYGNSGSTLGDCVVANYNQRGFSKADGRYTQMADNLTHITIWFGWNDMYYGPRMQKQMWVQATYGNSHWYPPNNDSSFIGQPGYVTQEEYDAVNAVTGEVGGVQYNDSQEYWKAVYVGTSSDATNKTFWGAWNIVLPYLINKYPYAKILLISPYGTNELMRQAVRDAAFKFGLQCYDFGKDQNQMFAHGWQDESEQGRIGSISVEQFRTNTLLSDGTHPNLQGNMYLSPSIGAKLMAL